jgi:hypothetical protein
VKVFFSTSGGRPLPGSGDHFPLSFIWRSSYALMAALARKRTLQNVASVFKKLEWLKGLAGFLG